MIKNLLKKLLRIDRMMLRRCFRYDENRFLLFSGAHSSLSASVLEAQIIMHYHVVEKGLTMPARRMEFGKQNIVVLIDLIENYLMTYGKGSAQVNYAIGVVKAYAELHSRLGWNKSNDIRFWARIDQFSGKYASIPCSCQKHFNRVDFYSMKKSPFEMLVNARHCVRNYTSAEVSREKIEAAVKLALTAPSSCNRNHCRVHCISDRKLCHKILEMQGGNRGFGHLADKVLVITADASCLMMDRERHDNYINGGIFLMNLCYALYVEEIAYCILTWAVLSETDLLLRKLVGIPAGEDVISLLCIGEAPDEFDVAFSPRRNLNEVLTWH